MRQKDLCFAIHVLEYGDTPATVRSSAWYLYQPNISFEDFTGQRIYGSKNIVVLFLHVNAKGLDYPSLRAAQAIPAQSLALQVGLLYDDSPNPRNRMQIEPLGEGAVDSAYMQVHYEAAVGKKTPEIQNHLSILKILGLANAAVAGEVTVATVPVIVWGSGVIQDATVPSDIRVAGYDVPTGDPTMATARDAYQLGSDVLLNNEGQYSWIWETISGLSWIKQAALATFAALITIGGGSKVALSFYRFCVERHDAPVLYSLHDSLRKERLQYPDRSIAALPTSLVMIAGNVKRSTRSVNKTLRRLESKGEVQEVKDGWILNAPEAPGE